MPTTCKYIEYYALQLHLLAKDVYSDGGYFSKTRLLSGWENPPSIGGFRRRAKSIRHLSTRLGRAGAWQGAIFNRGTHRPSWNNSTKLLKSASDMSTLSDRPDQNGESQPEEGEHVSDSQLGDEPEQSDEDDEEYDPPYSVKELAEIVLDFYKFLGTLHYDPSDLKTPPPEGWPVECLPKNLMKKKSPRAVELMCHLPYFKQAEKSTHVHYKCKLYDYTDAEQHDTIRDHDKDTVEAEELESFDGEKIDPSDMLVLAWGYESGGHYFFLDTLRSEITVDVVSCNLLSADPIENFFDDIKEKYRSLKLIPCPGRETEEAGHVPEREEHIDPSEVFAQGHRWGTDLDWQFVRQIYRAHGWPNAFQREEAIRVIEELALKGEGRGTWEEAFY